MPYQMKFGINLCNLRLSTRIIDIVVLVCPKMILVYHFEKKNYFIRLILQSINDTKQVTFLENFKLIR